MKPTPGNAKPQLGENKPTRASLDRLIAKKRDLKQAAMQQLLTGQTRLPGFSGNAEPQLGKAHEERQAKLGLGAPSALPAGWVVKRLASVGTFLKGSGVKKDEAMSGDLPCVRYGEIYTHHHDVVRVFNSFLSVSVAATATPLKKGDILFAGSGETKGEIGKSVAFVHGCEAYAGGGIVILRPEASDAVFLGYYLNSTPIQKQKASRGQGDAVVHISAKSLADVELTFPPLPGTNRHRRRADGDGPGTGGPGAAAGQDPRPQARHDAGTPHRKDTPPRER